MVWNEGSKRARSLQTKTNDDEDASRRLSREIEKMDGPADDEDGREGVAGKLEDLPAVRVDDLPVLREAAA